MDLAYVAAGRVDGFFEIGLRPWDFAAGEPAGS
ncbi:inositol monophosphatase family protein [Escherichia coli]